MRQKWLEWMSYDNLMENLTSNWCMVETPGETAMNDKYCGHTLKTVFGNWKHSVFRADTDADYKKRFIREVTG